MSRFQYADLQGAKWISAGGASRFPLFRGEFTLPKVAQARITIAGLGIFEVYINGKRISDDMFLPLNTDFSRREGLTHGGHPFMEELGHRVYCPQYDIGDFLREGINCICFLMGPGWYDCGDGPDDWRKTPSFGNVKVCYCIECEDLEGRHSIVCSNEDHRWKPGFVYDGHFLTGESQDYRNFDDNWILPDYDDSHWERVSTEEKPETVFYIQEAPADRVCRRLIPKRIFQDGDRRIYDAGEISTGYPILVSDAPAGTTVRVRYAERLDDNGNLDEERIYGQYTDFLLDGKSRKLHCQFTWLCYRYFEVIGDARAEECLVIHSDVSITSSFFCSQPVLNWLCQAYQRTQLANMHCGIPSDCPHIERRGYTGDGQLVCRAAMLQLDAKKFYEKWIYDIADCQDRKSGHVQYTAPFMPSGGGPGGWGCAIVTVPYAYYKQYGDIDICRELFPQMLQYLAFMEDHSEDGLVVSDIQGAWCLGDWCMLDMGHAEKEKSYIPAPFVNTYFNIKSMEYVLELAEILHLHHADTMLKKHITEKKLALVRRYYDPETGDFAKNRQGSNAFAIDLGLGDARTFENLVKHYQAFGQYDTGIFGTDILTRVLFERDRADLAVALLTNQNENSFYTHMQEGATTLYEYWTGHRSQCHPMFGAVTRYLFAYILGIRQEETSAGYSQVIIEPRCMEYIPFSSGHITTPHGVIRVDYNGERLLVEIPGGVRATCILDGIKIPLTEGKNNIKRKE